MPINAGDFDGLAKHGAQLWDNDVVQRYAEWQPLFLCPGFGPVPNF